MWVQENRQNSAGNAFAIHFPSLGHYEYITIISILGIVCSPLRSEITFISPTTVTSITFRADEKGKVGVKWSEKTRRKKGKREKYFSARAKVDLTLGGERKNVEKYMGGKENGLRKYYFINLNSHIRNNWYDIV